jgi:MFS family permease
MARIEARGAEPPAPRDEEWVTIPPGDGRTATFEALRNTTYRLLWAGSVLSFLAIQMQFIARGWLAFDLTGSNTGVGAIFLAFGVPMLLFTPWGGVAADRLSKRRVLLAAQCTLTAGATVIGLAIAFDVIQYWMLLASAVVQGTAFSFLGPTRMAFTGDIVGRDLLPNAIVLQQMSMNGTRIFGPSIAGVLIGVAFVGIGGVYLMCAAILAGATATTFFLPAGRPDADREVRTPLAEMADGVRYVRSHPPVFMLILASFMVVMVAFPYVAFLPALASDVFEVGPSGYGLLSGASAIGAVAATVFIASRAGGPGAWRIQTIAGICFGVGVAGLAVSPSFGLALVVIVFAGGAASGFQSLNNALALQHSDLGYHGRVQSLMMLSFSGFGMAALPLGAIADAVGLRVTMFAMGTFTVGTMTVYSLARRRVLARTPVNAA